MNRGKWTKTIHKYRNISIVKTNRKQIALEQATDGLELPMTLFSEEYHRLIRRINTNAWKFNKMLTEMSLFCFPQCTIDFSFASKSQIMPFSIYSTTRLSGCECDQKLKSTSTVWIQCFRVLNQNSTVEMSMSGHEKVTGFRYLLLLEELLRAECLRFPSNPGPCPDSYVEATPKWWCLEVGPFWGN